MKVEPGNVAAYGLNTLGCEYYMLPLLGNIILWQRENTFARYSM